MTAVSAILLALVPPVWVRATGDEVTLAMRPVDPLSFFRGNYMDIRYDVPIPPRSAIIGAESGDAVYVLFADERPGRVLEVTIGRPSPTDGQFCLRGRLELEQIEFPRQLEQGESPQETGEFPQVGQIEFPQLEQLFVSPDRAREIESLRGRSLAQLKVTGRCQAVLVDIVPE
jgi:hypothetical protein